MTRRPSATRSWEDQVEVRAVRLFLEEHGVHAWADVPASVRQLAASARTVMTRAAARHRGISFLNDIFSIPASPMGDLLGWTAPRAPCTASPGRSRVFDGMHAQ